MASWKGPFRIIRIIAQSSPMLTLCLSEDRTFCRCLQLQGEARPPSPSKDREQALAKACAAAAPSPRAPGFALSFPGAATPRCGSVRPNSSCPWCRNWESRSWQAQPGLRGWQRWQGRLLRTVTRTQGNDLHFTSWNRKTVLCLALKVKPEKSGNSRK